MAGSELTVKNGRAINHMTDRNRTLEALAILGVALLACLPAPAYAICNLIPPAERFLPSAIGSVSAPIASPGQTIRIRLTPCDSVPGGFSEIAADHQVTLTFLPPSGPPVAVAVPSANVAVPSEFCAFGGPCTELAVTIPSTAGAAGAYGLTGPARIDVKIAGTPVASIEELFQPRAAGSCALAPEGTFGKFTVLPPPNDFADLADGSTSEIQATLDATGSLLLPFDYLGVLPSGIGAPIARLVKGTTSIDAFTASPGQPLVIPCSDLVRSFTLDGRPLPPLLRVDETGRILLGTADGDLGIIRIARTGTCAGSPVGPIFDFSDRLVMDKGPIIISTVSDGLVAESGTSVQLRNLRTSNDVAAYTRSETAEGVDLNGDGDTTDQILEIVDVRTGTQNTTTLPVVETRADGQLLPTVAISGNLVAFLESEALQTLATPSSGDLNGDGDAFDSLLNVLGVKASGTILDLAAALSPTNRTADAAPLIDRRSVVISNGLVFFREPEWATLPQGTRLVSRAFGGGPSNGPSESTTQTPSLSRGASFVTFASDATNLISGGTTGRNYFVRDLSAGLTTQVNLDSSGMRCQPNTNGSDFVAISGDGRWVAFSGKCPSPLLPGESGFPPFNNIYLRDLQTSATHRVTRGLAGTFPNQTSYDPRLTQDGRFLTFDSNAGNLVADDANGLGDVFLYDRVTDTLTLESRNSAGDSGLGGSGSGRISDDGRYLAFVSNSTNFDPDIPPGKVHVYLRDRVLGSTTRVERCRTGGPGDGGSSTSRIGISSDGRYVVFSTDSSNLVSNDCSSDGDALSDVFVFDRLRDRIEQINFSSAGRPPIAVSGSFSGSMSADGRIIGFTSQAANLAPGDANLQFDGFLHDRTTGATQRASVTDTEGDSLGCPGGLCITDVTVSSDGATAAFASDYTNLVAGDANGFRDVFVRGSDGSQDLDLDGNGESSDVVLRVFDPQGPPFLLQADIRANEVSVAGGRALILSPDGAGSQDAWLFDGNTNSRIDLGEQANRVSLSEDILAITIPGVTRDTLAVRKVPVAGPGPTGVPDTGIAAAEIRAARSTVVLATAESAVNGSAPVAADLNGDGDTADRVLRIYRDEQPQLINVGQAVEEFEVDPDPATGHLVAFRTFECDQGGPLVSSGCPSGGTDLNNDGDVSDFVLQIYDLDTDTFIPTGQAAIPCTIPGCEPGLAYKVHNNTVSFLTRECDQGGPLQTPSCPSGGTDLNGNGTPDDIVVQVLNVRTGRAQVFDATDLADGKAPPPLPDQVFDSPILYSTVAEADSGVDLNKDGDTDDVVTLIVGDQDDDGVFDESGASGGDVCSEKNDPDQVDTDRDGIGDACDATSPYCGASVPPAPAIAPPDAAACQRKVASLSLTYFKKRVAAQRSCFKHLAEGTISGNAATLCRGRFVGDTEILPADDKTAGAIQKATAAFNKALAKACDATSLAQLDTCASASGAPSLTSADRCLRRAYGAAADEASQLSYGELQSQVNADVRRCQLAIGDASNEFASSVLRATNTCLFRILAGSLSGDPQQLCLSSSAEGGVLAPGDAKTAALFVKAAAKVAKRLDQSCPDGPGVPPAENGLIGSTAACAALSPRTEASVGACITCSQWQRAMEMLRASFGPS